MKLLLLGATGRVGSEIARLAAKDGHQVNVLVRTPEKLPSDVNAFHVYRGDATVKEDIEQAIEGCDTVISTLSSDGGTVLTEAVPLVIKAMQDRCIKRLLTIGTAGILNSRTDPGLLRYQSSESKRKLTRAAREHHDAYLAIKESSLDWTIVCPTYLPDGPPTGSYRTEKDYLPLEGKQISTGDTAEFAYKELSSEEFLHSRVGIAY
ncbi:SDR family oxidoreductase [Fictibacillus enclensis]|uniref:NAD(P)-dependent oxidoreductase n=1 Tax=Fictibacillus enclensis TaxID=1017270 RepID=UPI0025A2717D|nr:SDR family oxidoreductase [Fictibacillus enclensis]MDM5340884.1 SDR family oxidoreductase [Fictibacillus enclensis]